MKVTAKLGSLCGGAVLAITVAGCYAPPTHLEYRHMIPDNVQTIIPLQVGDVVWLTTYVKGWPAGHTPKTLQNANPPWSETIRLPLRHALDTLTPDEANLMTSFFVTHANTAKPHQDTHIYIEKKKISLWNAFVDALQLSTDGQLHVRFDKFCPRFYNMTGNVGTLKDDFFKKCKNPLSEPVNEPRNIPKLESFQQVDLPGANPKGDSDVFYGNFYVITSFARVEMAAAVMQNQSEQEARWSLAEWEASGICVDTVGNPMRIVNVFLKEEPFRPLHIVPLEFNARYTIRLCSKTDDKCMRLGERVIGVKQDGQPETLSQSSLAVLTARDVRDIQWGPAPSTTNSATHMPLSPMANSACLP